MVSVGWIIYIIMREIEIPSSREMLPMWWMGMCPSCYELW
jgi:hypothetical protein